MPPLDSSPVAVPFCDVGALNLEVWHALADAFDQVRSRGNFIHGDECRAFEAEWADFCGRAHALGVGNGYDALRLMMQALGIGPGDEVIVPAHTFNATWSAVCALCAVPVAVDARSEANPTIDPEKVVLAITARTKAILVTHIHGIPCDMETLRRIADKAGVPLLVDAAQAHGMRGAMLGDAAAFSFYPTKNLGALGDGGAVVTDHHGVADAVAALRNYGGRGKDVHDVLGSNSRMDELQAGFLRVKLPLLDGYNARRAANVAALGLIPRGVNHHCVIFRDDRDTFARRLNEAGVATMVHYPTPPHLQPAFEPLGYKAGDFPVVESIASRILSLPCGPELTPVRVARIRREVEALS